MIYNYQNFLFEYQHKDTQMLLTELADYFTIGFEIEIEVDRNRLNESLSDSNTNDLIKKIQSVLTNDLLIPYWQKHKQPEDHPHFGHCYASSEALFHLLGGKAAGYTPVRVSTSLGTHWWIRDKNGNILDPTSEQFTSQGIEIPYNKGIGSGFLTKEPSKRAQEIIRRVSKLNESAPFNSISRPYKKSINLFNKNFTNFIEKYSDIIDFHFDETLIFGLEIVNKPFKNLNTAIEYITDFFEEHNKQSIFQFKKSTSIHVNIGTSTDKEWDIVKGLVMLSDNDKPWSYEPDYKPKVPFIFKDMENRSFNLFCKSLKDQILQNPIVSGNTEIYQNIISTTNIGEIRENLIKLIKRIIPQQEKIGKGIGFNIGKILYGMDKYVEFRYVGGDNITNEIVVEKIKYFCYIIYLMTSHYKDKDFIHKLFSFVNKVRDKYEKWLKFNKDLDWLLRKR